METAAIVLHELFATLRHAGFTEDQALKLCATLMERTACE